jgi:hypothetical protein
MSAVVLSAIGLTKAAWQALPPERKRKIREQIKKGNKGMAKILAKNAKKTRKAVKKAFKKPKGAMCGDGIAYYQKKLRSKR